MKKVFRAAILTAKEVELTAVRRHLIQEERVDDTHDGTVYRKAKIRQSLASDQPIEHWDVAICRTGRGQQPATYGVQLLIQHFRPDVVLYVGVAGGDPKHSELSVGDVVIGKAVRYYERGAQYENEFAIKGSSQEPNRALTTAAEYEAGESAWLGRVAGGRKNTKVFVEEIASGEKVQKSSSSKLWEVIKTSFPDVIAVETEGQGFHYSVNQSAGRGLMVRAISDFLDNKDDDESHLGTDDDRQALASDHAAAFAVNLIANLNTKFLENLGGHGQLRYAVILKISASSVEGVYSATRLLADAINDPHLTVESLQPANSYIVRIGTKLHSAAYAHAAHKGRLLSPLIGTDVLSLQSDAERTGEPIFDELLTAVACGNPKQILGIQEKFVDNYPSWRASAAALERVILGKQPKTATPPDEEVKDGRYVRRIRSELGISAKELAAEANVDPSSLSRIENGRVSGGAAMRRILVALEQLGKRRGRG